MPTDYADELRRKLNQAIQQAVCLRGSYADDVRHFSRNRKLPLETLILFMLTMTGGTLARELYDAGIEIAASSFVGRRKQIGYGCFREVMQRFNGLCEDPATVKGDRLWAVDGSTVPCPRNPNSNNHFTSESNQNGWNNTHINLVLYILNQTFVDCYMGKDAIDSRIAHDEQGALCALIYKWKFHQPTIPMKCHAVRFMLDSGQYETLLTNLPRDEFSISDLEELYHMRWKIETNIRFLKYGVGLLNLHSRTDELIFQEIYAHLTMFNFCNRICRKIEIPQKPGNKYERKIDMTMAIYLCKKFFRNSDFSGEKLIRDTKRYVQPVRPNRADERNLKVKTFPAFPYRIPS